MNVLNDRVTFHYFILPFMSHITQYSVITQVRYVTRVPVASTHMLLYKCSSQSCPYGVINVGCDVRAQLHPSTTI